MKPTHKFILSTLFALSLFSCSDSPSPNWQHQGFTLESVSAEFPAAVKTSKRTVGSAKIEHTQAAFRGGEFSVSMTKGAPPSVDNFYPHALTRKGATLEETSDISVIGYQGKHFVMTFRNKKAFQRFINYDGTLVVQTVIVNANDYSEEVVNKFFDSLML